MVIKVQGGYRGLTSAIEISRFCNFILERSTDLNRERFERGQQTERRIIGRIGRDMENKWGAILHSIRVSTKRKSDREISEVMIYTGYIFPSHSRSSIP